MATDIESGNWIPLVEFSVQKSISLSTLRRYIKSNKIPWKLVEGRYLVMDDGSFNAPRNHDPKGVASPAPPREEPRAKQPPAQQPEQVDFESRIRQLETSLTAANEEIAELQTLVAFYEEKWSLLSKE